MLLALGFNSCKTKNIKTSIINKTEFIEIGIKKRFSLNETVKIKITNISGKNLVLYEPTKTNIEKKTNDKWKKLRILYCPCDAPCNAPPEKLDLPNGKEINLSWNQKESYCGKITDSGIRETVRKEVNKGAYRLVVMYKLNNERNTIYKEFTIK